MKEVLDKANRVELGVAYGGSAGRAVEWIKGVPEAEREEAFKEAFNFLFNHWQEWYMENVLPPEERVIQTKE